LNEEDFVDFLEGLEASIVKMKMQIAKLVGSEAKPKAKISEETFSILKWDNEKGERLGDFQAAYKNKNVLENWQHAFNILKQANAVIGNPFHMEGYQYRYWIYPEKYEDRIFRKKLNEVKG
jgi:hypothetical protein